MKNAIIIINLFCCIQLSAQLIAPNMINDLHLEQDYKGAQRQYDLGLYQSKIANKWGITTLSLSAISLLGFAIGGEMAESNLFTYWAPVVSIGTATVGVFIKISSISNIETGRYKMDQINIGKFDEIGWIQIGATKNGIGLTYNF